jgi:hypothetical protein
MFDADSLVVARDFLLKGMPWDLSQPRFMDFQREHIAQKVQADPMFATKLREVALEALESDEPSVIRRGLTALAFVGTSADVPTIKSFNAHDDSDVSKDARTCLYEIRKQVPLAVAGVGPHRERTQTEPVSGATMTPKKPTGRHLCPVCRGSGLDPALKPRYTSGGHDDRTCPRCLGECFVDTAEGDGSPGGEGAETRKAE